MALILPVNGIYPRFGKNCFLAENATIIGDVEIQKKRVSPGQKEIFEKTPQIII